jgi:hypothetical protein
MKKKKQNNFSLDDYIKANRKASREAEIATFGHPICHKKIHTSKKVYNRKRMKAGRQDDLPFLYSI